MQIFRLSHSFGAFAARTAFCGAIAALALPAIAQTVPAPVAAAKSWTVFDASTGRMLASQEPGMRIIPASLTKVMTAYLVFEAIREKRLQWDQMVNVSLNAYRVDKSSSKMFIDPKVPVSIKDLTYGLIIQSGNDAAVQLAEAVAGSEETFAAMMNKKAGELGMKGTHFMNASGLPHPDHYSTAEDLTILAARLIHDFPEEYKIYSIKEFTYNKIKQGNRNVLLYTDPTVDGMKTGYVTGSGYNLIASAKRPGVSGDFRVISVVTGTASPHARGEESRKLLGWAFSNFEAVKVASKGQQVGTPVVWKGTQQTVKVGIAADRYETFAKGAGNKVKTEVVLQDKLMAPLASGSKVGVVKISYDGKPIGEVPVVALEEVKEAGFFARIWDSIRLRFA
ncbi:penicillin-binding protein 6. Serine peptidase. MEROPS family S11 [Noviherbaspirillum humi]|uniref:serine-type D-Ala-D-Ala carboxypeptidase n=1 Tax=Noviherbaspirillum humi TaxID=1688639 RepID=A0A239F4R7_9BURK|nr:D-alanyl-D-alanine carboxypeptidase family protein [Noviherbaspirillum humi]SNS51152.1 penicillin-binding protein 6. Serine peptidase. MEROPS family S11 [Noviherbaspirillum humi]